MDFRNLAGKEFPVVGKWNDWSTDRCGGILEPGREVAHWHRDNVGVELRQNHPRRFPPGPQHTAIFLPSMTLPSCFSKSVAHRVMPIEACSIRINPGIANSSMQRRSMSRIDSWLQSSGLNIVSPSSISWFTSDSQSLVQWGIAKIGFKSQHPEGSLSHSTSSCPDPVWIWIP